MTIQLQEIQDVIAVTVAFLPFHQSFIDVWKLFGVRTRRYWEALTYIVFGSETGPIPDNTWKRKKVDVIKGFVVGIPTTFHTEFSS